MVTDEEREATTMKEERGFDWKMYDRQSRIEEYSTKYLRTEQGYRRKMLKKGFR